MNVLYFSQIPVLINRSVKRLVLQAVESRLEYLQGLRVW